ncbi:MAG TPA: hypothetical protein VL334_00225 [Anaerolineae bacterium]|nr:hypothetical protein [Anaerolineae bacterium]
MSSALNIMAWREILARTLQGFAVEFDVSPAWLVNPATKRRLKLDQLYPQAGLAVRFVGLTAKGQPKQSDWELQEDALRDQTREELCRQHGVELFLLDPDHPHPSEQLQHLRTILSRLSRTLAQSDRPDQDKLMVMPLLAEARGRLDEVTRRIKHPEDLALFAELWRDRETATIVAAAQPPAPSAGIKSMRPLRLDAGARVAHARFGPGMVEAVTPDGGDSQITILFDRGEQRTFLASLVSDKLQAL